MSGRSGRSTPGRPQWLKEWVAEQGQWVLLVCGHKDNLVDRSCIVIKQFGGKKVDVYCDTCNDFRVVKQYLKNRNADKPPAVIPDEPMF